MERICNTVLGEALEESDGFFQWTQLGAQWSGFQTIVPSREWAPLCPSAYIGWGAIDSLKIHWLRVFKPTRWRQWEKTQPEKMIKTNSILSSWIFWIHSGKTAPMVWDLSKWNCVSGFLIIFLCQFHYFWLSNTPLPFHPYTPWVYFIPYEPEI